MTNKTIKIICFDLGGVLLEVNWQLTLDHFKITEDAAKVTQKIGQSKAFLDYEKGQVTAPEFCQFLNKEFKTKLTAGQFIEGWNKCLTGAIRGTTEIIESIPSQYSLFALSNTNQEHYDYYKMFPIFKKFKKIIASQHLGLRKPDPQIYQQSLSIMQAHPEQVIYFDDLIENVKGAEDSRINAFHVQNPKADITSGLKKFNIF